ncbi:hypothetical protein H2O64_16730 [Kordia sp. YSTF-M3]|uniref:Class I lanthipeptide n=1 Tax=Kordia aestuariivivens TaxID=2759037 RepID=A0ABR7QCS4_9FLAO|nr:hypothetical protein [Kordia aestuariivivens]MBC8756322.1 hypothetical protein [Kordia aestuariivivens]
MKKKEIKSLSLNKRSISTLQQDSVVGGATIGTLCALISNVFACPSETCISTAQTGGVVQPTCANCDQ